MCSLQCQSGNTAGVQLCMKCIHACVRGCLCVWVCVCVCVCLCVCFPSIAPSYTIRSMVNDDVFRHVWSFFAKEKKDVWFPLYAFKNPFVEVDLEALLGKFLDKTSPEYDAYVNEGLDGVFMSGFGGKSGDFHLLINDKGVRIKVNHHAFTVIPPNQNVTMMFHTLSNGMISLIFYSI